MSTLMVLCFTLAFLPGCEEPKKKEPTAEEQQALKIEAQNKEMAKQLAKLHRLVKFSQLCETNDGVKYFHTSHSCGRYCSRPYIECNNGLSAWLKDE